MSAHSIYRDIAERTGGDIYIGVVGPVRSGKSTFIKRFMESLVLPNITEGYSRERARDEMPQSAAGKTVMTTEPKFIPDEAVTVHLDDAANEAIGEGCFTGDDQLLKVKLPCITGRHAVYFTFHDDRQQLSWGLHDRKLTRPVMGFAIARGKPVLDGKLVTLLHLIRETQSVRDACSRIQISYSTAWNMLNTAENALGYPLLLRNKGGPSGTGSLLTEKGQELLSAYAQFESAAKENMEKLYDSYLRDIL